MNPYTGNTFFEFFQTCFLRLGQFFSDPIAYTVCSDELQMLVLFCVSISSSLVGTFLVLRRVTMLANAISHTILPGVVLAFILYETFYLQSDVFDFSHLLPSEWLLIVCGLFMAFLTTFLCEFFVKYLKIAEDASTGLVFTFLFAFGIIVVTMLSKNAHIGAELLLGNVDALSTRDFQFSLWICILNALICCVFFRGFFITTFDPVFSKVLDFSPVFFGYLLMGQLAITAIGAFRSVGVLLFLAFLVYPPLIARMYTDCLKRLIFIGVSVCILSSFIAVAFSRHLLSQYDLPVATQGLVVVVLVIVFSLSFFWKYFIKEKNIFRKLGRI